MTVEEHADTNFVVRLSELSSEDAERAGAKAANEAELLRAGFKVPDAIVLTTDAYEYFLQANHIRSNQTREGILSASIPEPILDALRAGIAGLGDYPLAIRSSAVAEDLPGASFAGQYETILNVRGDESLQSAVLRCWASAFSPRVVAYRDQQGLSSNGMAVLVQRMVPADVAGVAFSANPVSGDRDEVVVNAVRGLGERLVSGQVSPDEWTAKNGQIQCLRAPEEALDTGKVRAIAKMARRIETHFGAPQDIEWALADGKLYVLQARPITTLPEEEPELIPIPIEVPPGFWQLDATRAPDPPSPMMWVILEVAEPGINLMATEFGLLTEGQEFALIGGWLYNRLKPLGGKEPPAVQLPKPIMQLMVRLVPMMRVRIKNAVEAIREDKPGRIIHQWYDEWLPGLKVEIAHFRDMALGDLPDTALIQHFEDVLGFTRRMIGYHALLGTSVNLILYELASTCRDLLGWDEAQAFDLVSGTSYKSTEPAGQLYNMAQMAQEHQAVGELLEDINERTVERLMEVDREFADAFSDYQKNYGCRTLRLDIMNPSLAERPALTLSLIRDQIVNGYNPAKIEAELEQIRSRKAAQAKSILAEQPKSLARFERVLERAQMAYPLREANQFYTFSAPIALIRYAVLEIGNRLADRGVIAERDDVFFLYKAEACSALLDGGDHRELVRRRRGEMAWAEVNPGPPYYGEPPNPPSFDFLPREPRLIMESLIWSFNQMMEYEGSKREQKVGETLTGIPASAGQYTGPVRVILDESQFHKIQPGDVMVCPMTSPVWSVLFPSIGALVTDSGGLLSHPAIIAREYRIPSVVATGNATSLLHDGEIVTVDGTKGKVGSLSS
jgi:phosphohistidine swiveling domain-containing protein